MDGQDDELEYLKEAITETVKNCDDINLLYLIRAMLKEEL